MSEIKPRQDLPRKESVVKVVQETPQFEDRENTREAQRLEAETRQRESLEQIRAHITSELSEMKKSLNTDQVLIMCLNASRMR
jgi:hypothetical protein